MDKLNHIQRIQRWWRKIFYIDVFVVSAMTDPISPWFLPVKNKKHRFQGRRRDSSVFHLKKLLAKKVGLNKECLILYFGDILLRDDILLQDLMNKDVVVYDMVKEKEKGIRLHCYSFMFGGLKNVYTSLLNMYTYSQQKVLRCLTTEQATSDALMFEPELSEYHNYCLSGNWSCIGEKKKGRLSILNYIISSRTDTRAAKNLNDDKNSEESKNHASLAFDMENILYCNASNFYEYSYTSI